MIANVAKWGNSLAVRIPAESARQLELAEGAQVDLAVENGTLVVRPIVEPLRFDLATLLAGITPENLHSETTTGDAVGDEV